MMKKLIRWPLLLAILFGVAYAGMFQSVPHGHAQLLKSGKEKQECSSCGMDLVMFYKTSHAVKLKEGGVKQYCSMHCMVVDRQYILNESMVVDIQSLKFIPTHDAYYVVGSTKSGTMSRVSKYAFAQKKEAEAFAGTFGGRVMRFNEAVKIAEEELR